MTFAKANGVTVLFLIIPGVFKCFKKPVLPMYLVLTHVYCESPSQLAQLGKF